MPRTYKCPFDDTRFLKIPDLIKYVSRNYSDKIPSKYEGDVVHFLYDYRNGPGRCQICGDPTKWIPKKGRYDILCDKTSEKGNTCREAMRKKFIENATKKDGYFNYMEQPGFQQKLLANRRISHVIEFKGKEFTVVGSYEKLFLEVLDKYVTSAKDVMAPGPEVTWRDGDGKERLHITDFYLPRYKCIVSIKDGGDNKNNHPSMVKRRHEDALKFKALVDKTKYHLIELNGKNQIYDFGKYFKALKEHIKKGKRFIFYPDYYKDEID